MTKHFVDLSLELPVFYETGKDAVIPATAKLISATTLEKFKTNPEGYTFDKRGRLVVKK